MKRNYKYFFSLTPALIVIGGNLLGGWMVISNLVYSLGLIALLEIIFPSDSGNLSERDAELPDVLLFVHAFLQIFCLLSLGIFVTGKDHSFLQMVLAAISTGINTGSSGITVAHELIHRKNKWFILAGKFLLFTAGNIYLFVDHLRVHHKWVGTKRDPATPRKWENLYYFFIRSTIGQISCAYKLEKASMKNSNKQVFHPSNNLMGSVYLLVLFLLALIYFFGAAVGLAFIFQCLTANFMLEYTNYIEHYGLKREENEKITEFLSWQSDSVISRFLLIDLSRHADHHNVASKPYHTLDSYSQSPMLPSGYASMFYVAMFPTLWFRIMHRKLNVFETKQFAVAHSASLT